MNPKIEQVFATFTARYGLPGMKDGQSLEAIASHWTGALSSYAVADLQTACASWMNTSKFPRWPEPAELLEILRGFHAKPETKAQIELSPRTKQAAADASLWYQGLLSRPLPEGAWPSRWDDVLQHVIGAAEHKGKSFAWLLTHAWLNGTIPGDFDRRAQKYFAECRQRREAYAGAVKQHGAAKVHEGRCSPPQLG